MRTFLGGDKMSKRNPDAQMDMLAYFLSGETVREVAARYNLSTSNTDKHIRRAWSRVRAQLLIEPALVA
jgi:DNA-directed RNA polymerase specialized sigma24 family protein